ncbi:MAG TPA: hypothetical protein DDY98_08885 [Ruminococcaceae bacterium]|nr:hypothetical protein [Oscillospiraceae bacterium]
MTETVIFYVLSFFLYSAVGWFVESCYCSVKPKKWVNRGFLYGPLCPIYGSGAVMLKVALGRFAELPIYFHRFYLTPLLTFLLGALLADVLEFFTSLLMEKLFHARWWDYSEKKFNLQGRICLSHTLYWGGATLIFLYWIDPTVSSLLLSLSPFRRALITGITLFVFLIDLVLTVQKTADLRKLTVRIDSLTVEIKKLKEQTKSKTSEVAGELSAEIREQLEAVFEHSHKLFMSNPLGTPLNKKVKKQKRKAIRFFRVNPGFRHRVAEKTEELKKLTERFH